jgi:hypothetical protein
MLGLDVYEQMSMREQEDFMASIEHWGSVPEGGRAAQSRVNQEHEDPLIVAIKAGKQRFTAFREESGPTWIVCDHYLKEVGSATRPETVLSPVRSKSAHRISMR